MNGKVILANIIIVASIAACSGFSNDKQENIYEVIEKTEGDIKYPQIDFLSEDDSKKEEKINSLILNTLYGPYDFLSDPEISASIAYEVTYNDENYLSICYRGTYTDKSSYAGDVGYAITIDLNNEMIVELEDIIEDEGRNKIKTKIEKGEFETESGVITLDNKYIDVNSIIDEQPAVNSESEESQYYFFLRDKKIGIIIIGLPRYGGNYSIVNVNYSWMP